MPGPVNKPPASSYQPKVILTEQALKNQIELARMYCKGGDVGVRLKVTGKAKEVRRGRSVEYKSVEEVFESEKGRIRRAIREIERKSGGSVKISGPTYLFEVETEYTAGGVPVPAPVFEFVYVVEVHLARLEQAFTLLAALGYTYSIEPKQMPKVGSDKFRNTEAPMGAHMLDILKRGRNILKEKFTAWISQEFNVKERYRSGEIGDKWDFYNLRLAIWHETMEAALLALFQEILGTLKAVLEESTSDNEVDLALDRQLDVLPQDAFLYWPGDPPFDSFEALTMYWMTEASRAERIAMAREHTMTYDEAYKTWMEVFDLWTEARNAALSIPDVSRRTKLENYIFTVLDRVGGIINELDSGTRGTTLAGPTAAKTPSWEISYVKGRLPVIRYHDWPGKFEIKITDSCNKTYSPLAESISSGVFTWDPTPERLNPGTHRVRIAYEKYAGNDLGLLKKVNPQELSFVIPPPDFNVVVEDILRLVTANISYSGFYHGFEADVFDSKGNKLSSPLSPITGPASAGELVWGDAAKQGTYTIKTKGGSTKKVEFFSRIDPSWDENDCKQRNSNYMFWFTVSYYDWRQLDPFEFKIFDPSGAEKNLPQYPKIDPSKTTDDLTSNIPGSWQGGTYTIKVITDHPRVTKTQKFKLTSFWRLEIPILFDELPSNGSTDEVYIMYANWPRRFEAEILNYKNEGVDRVIGSSKAWEARLPWGKNANPGTYWVKVNLQNEKPRAVIITKKLEWSACVKFGTSGPYISITPKTGTKWPRGKGFGFSIHPEGSTSSIGYVTVSDSNQTGEVTWGKESGQKFPKWGRYTIWAYAKDPGLQAMFSNRSLCPNWRTDVEIPEPGFKVNGCKASVGVAASGPWIAPDKEQSLSIEYDNWPGKFKAKIRKRSSTQELVKLEGTSATRGSFTKKVTLPTRAYWIEARPYEGYIPLAIELTAVNP